MKSFTCALAAAAIASLASAQLACMNATTSTEADCNSFKNWAELVEPLGYSWELVDVETSDGYQLRLVHLVRSAGGAPTPV